MDIQNSLILHVLVILFVVTQLALSQDYDEEKEAKPSWSRCSYSWSNFKNGRAKVRARGRLTKFACNSGFELVGKRFATCVRGQWNHPSPVCIARGCYRLPVPANSRVKESYRGAYLVYECLPGYSLKGPTFLYCDGLSWNDVTPTCEASIENPETSCDFEDPDLCGWVNDVADDFDWLRHNLETPSGYVGTGPSHDHTFGAGKAGFYMYEEASAPRKEHDVARLFSPVFPRQSGPSCFVFWYHMYGAGMGTLRIYVKSESYIFGELNPSWEKTGDQGNQWFLGKVTVPAFHERFQIIFEGLRGSAYLSDMAIDDINLLQTDCDSVDSTDLVVAKASLDSCRGRCWERDNSEVCSCSEYCLSNNSCCSDYYKICYTGNDLNNTSDLEGPSEENPNADQSVTTTEVREVEAITTSQTNLASTSSISIQTVKIPSTLPFTTSLVPEITRNSFRTTGKPSPKITLPFSETSSRTTIAIPRITSEDSFFSSSVKPTRTSTNAVRTTTAMKTTTASTTTVSTLSTMKITPRITTPLRTTPTPRVITTPKTTTPRTTTTQRSTTTTQPATTAWRTTTPPRLITTTLPQTTTATAATTPRTVTTTTTQTPRTTTTTTQTPRATTTTQTTATRVVTSPVAIMHPTISTFKTPLITFQSTLTSSVNIATTEKEPQLSVETKFIASTKSSVVFTSPIPQISEFYSSTRKNPQTVATVPAWVKPDTLSISSSTKDSILTTKNSMDNTSKYPTLTTTLLPMLRTASTNTNQTSTTASPSFRFNTTTLLPPITAKITVTPRYNFRPRFTTKFYSPSTRLVALRTTKLPTRATSITSSTTLVTQYNFRPRYTSMRVWPSFTRSTTAKPIWTTKPRNRWTFIDITTKKWSTKSVMETTLQKSMTENPFNTTVRIIENNREQMKANSGLYATGIIVSVLIVVALAGGTVYFLFRNKKKQIQKHLSEDSEIRFLSDNEVIEFSDPSALHRLRYE